MYPQLRIDLSKIRKNLDTVVSIAKQGGCSLMIVTKGFCADEHIVGEILKNDYVSYLADSRVQNLASYVDKAHMAGKETVLLRLPMLCEIEDVERIHAKMETLLGKEGAHLDEIRFCPHHPDNGYQEENPLYKIPCHCRKPDIGMIEDCVEKYNIDLASSWMVGDTTIDIQTGKNAGTHTALVLTGDAGNDKKYNVQADMICRDVLEAVEHIVG